MMMEKLQQERLSICVTAMASCRRALDDTIAYAQQRKAFGKPIAHFQNTQFTLAELATQIQIGQAFVDQLLTAHVRGDEIVSEVSMGKWWTTDLQKRVVAECLQLHGGYGFMHEYPISHGLRRRRRAIDLRGLERDHEGDHREADGPRGLIARPPRPTLRRRAAGRRCSAPESVVPGA